MEASLQKTGQPRTPTNLIREPFYLTLMILTSTLISIHLEQLNKMKMMVHLLVGISRFILAPPSMAAIPFLDQEKMTKPFLFPDLVMGVPN